MAESYTDELNRIKSELGKIQSQAGKNMDDLAKKTKSYANSWSEVGKKISDSFDPVAKSGKLIAQLEAQQADSSAKEQGFQQKKAELLNTHKKFRSDLARYDELQALSRTGLNASQQREFQQLQEIHNKRGQISQRIKEQLIDTQGKIRTEQQLQKTLENQINGEKQFAAAAAIAKETLKAMYAMAGEYDKFLSEQAKTLGVSKDIIDAQYKSIQKNNTGFKENAATSREILAAQTKILQDYPLIGKQASNVAQSVAQTAKSTGLSVEESTKLQSTLAEIGGTSLSAQNNMAGFAIQAAKAYGVPLNVLLKDVANASSAVRTIFKGNTEELIKQAAEARKLGTSLDAAAKSAESLLNFESSIGAELKASALLGQSLNFNESRRLAFAGDILGAEKALQKELEKVGDLDKLNYNQRKALAEATGKDFGELQKIQTQKKNQLEIERRFPEEAKKLKMMQDDLSKLQKKSKEDRDAEYKKILEQQKVEAQSQLIAQAKAAAMDKIGQVLKPVYDLFTKIQTVFFNLISMAPTWVVGLGLVIATIVGIALAVGSVLGGFKLFQKAVEGLGEAAGKGVGKGLKAMSGGIRSFGNALKNFPVGKLIGISVALGITALAAMGLAKAFQMMGQVSGKDVLLLSAALIGLGAALVIVGALMTGPQIIGVLLFAAALAVVSLAAMGFAKALQMIGPQLKIIGITFVALGAILGGVIAKAFDTMLAVFKALPAVIGGVAGPLIKLALVSPLLFAAALGVGALTYSLGALGVALLLFPTRELTRVTSQLALLAISAAGIREAVASLKELSGIKLPKIELGGVAALAAVSAIGAASKNKETQELKQGLEVVAQKIDTLTNLMASGGIAVNLDGQKVNYALAKSSNNRGSLGQATF